MKDAVLKQQNILKSIRCMKCGKMLAKNTSIFGIEVKCLRCGTLNLVLEKMIEQVIITNCEGVILFINKAVEIATGFSLHEVIGKKPSDLWGGHMSKKFYVDMWDKILKKKESVKIKITNKDKFKKAYDVELLISPIFDTSGKIIFFVGIETMV